MRATSRWRTLLVLCAALLALACWRLAGLDHGTVKAALDARSADGDVESYDAAFHAHIQLRLKLLAFAALAVAIAVVLMRRAMDRWFHHGGTALRSWWTDVAGSTRTLVASTGRWEAAMLVLLLAIAAALRGAQLALPITYDEAFTCTYYAARPWYIIVSDHSYPNNHILHTLLVKAGLGLLGWGEVQARIPAFAAAMVAMVLCWVWVRSLAGRGVAMMTLALCAVSAPLVEYGALARGYSITWACMLASLLFARHLVRTGSSISALALAGIHALGLWAVPTMIYATLACYIWAFLLLRARIGAIDRSRAGWLLASTALCAAITLMLYAPAILAYGPAHLLHHDTMGPRTWSHFGGRIVDMLRAASTDPAALAVIAAMILASIMDASYRRLVLAFVIAIVPLVLLQRMIGPPRIWLFLLFIALPAVPIAITAGLEQIRGMDPTRPHARRSVLAMITAALVALAMIARRPSGIDRFPGADQAAIWFAKHLGPGDRVLVDFPVEAPLEFQFRKHGLGIEPLYGSPSPGAKLWFVIGEDYDQTFAALAARARLPRGSWSDPRPVAQVDRMAIFAARYQ